MKKFTLEDLILFENQELLAINKPAGISTLEDRMDSANVLSVVKQKYPQIQVSHRLDKYTSGVLLFAKNSDSYRQISLQFQNREVGKVYHAVVHGQTNFQNHEINTPILIKNSGPVSLNKRKGKESNTIFNTLKNFKNFSLIECKPKTGRKHQIRIHIQSTGHSIMTDTTYGGKLAYLSELKRNYKSGRHEEKPLIDRFALHAYELSFTDNQNVLQTIKAPYPKDFKLLLKMLEKYNS